MRRYGLAEPLTEEQQQKRCQAVRDLMLTTPFLAGLGFVSERYEPDDVTIRLPFRDDLTNDGTYFHGGVIGSVMGTVRRRRLSANRVSVRRPDR